MDDIKETPDGRVLPDDGAQGQPIVPLVSSTGTAMDSQEEKQPMEKRTFFPESPVGENQNAGESTPIKEYPVEEVPPSIEHATLGQMAAQMQALARAEKESKGLPVEAEEEENDDDVNVIADGQEATGRWTREEHELFLEALKKYGKEWKKIAGAVQTRTIVQTRTHAQKFFQKVTKGQSGNDLYDDGDGTGNGGSARRTSSRTRKPTSVFSNGEDYFSPGVTATALSSSTRRGDDTRLEDRLSTDKHAISTPLLAHKPKPSEAKRVVSSSGAPQEAIGSLATLGVHDDLPQPSPAACGTRKDAELNAAASLVSSAGRGEVTSSSRSREDDGADVLSSLKKAKTRPGEIVRRQRVKTPSLTIVAVGVGGGDGNFSKSTSGQPTTPWERDMKALTDKDKTRGLADASVSTPSQQNDFLSRVRRCVQTGDAGGLKAVLRAAEANSSDSANAEVKDKGKEGEGEEETGAKRKAGSQGGPDQKRSSISTNSNGNSHGHSASLMSMTLNRLGSSGSSVLMDACRLDSAMFNQQTAISLARLLIEHGASSSVVGRQGHTCLHRAAEQGYEEVARLVLNRGCPINEQDNDGNTACHVAVTCGHGAILELLADFGSNCHIRNNQGRNALDLAGTGSTSSSNHTARGELRRILLSVEPRLRTLVLYHDDCLEHSPRRPDDWEGPDRLLGIMQRLQNPQEFAEHELEITTNFDKAGVELLSRVHSPEYLAFVDKLSKKMQSDVNKQTRSRQDVVPFTPQVQRELLNRNYEELKKIEFSDTSFSAGTLDAARRASGAVAHAVDRVLLGRNRNAFCCVRPPGHHAGYSGLLTSARSCGFCIFNSIAGAAFHALEQHKCDRVAIVDLDVHHGNGTEDIVRRYPHPHRLLFFSLHIYDKGDEQEPVEKDYEFFPGSGAAGESAHNIINVPIQPLWRDSAPTLQKAQLNQSSTKSSSSGSSSQSNLSVLIDKDKDKDKEGGEEEGGRGAAGGDSSSKKGNLHARGPLSGKEAYRKAVQDRLLPALRAFNPSLILMSTGFDPAYGDVGNTRSAPSNPKITQTGMNLEPEDFSWVTGEIMKIADLCCNGKVVSVLEGGYGSYATTKELYPRTKKVTRSDKAKESKSKDTEKGTGKGKEKGGEEVEPATAKQGPMMNRHILASAATSHVHRLVDPYAGQPASYPLLCVEVPVDGAARRGGAKKGRKKDKTGK